MDDSKLPKSEIRKVEIVHFECSQCGYKGITYYLAGDAYGLLLGQTSDYQLAVFDTWRDKAFYKEIKSIVINSLNSPKEPKLGDCFRKGVGLISDPSPSGLRYDFSGKSVCPKCESAKIKLFMDNPIRFDNIKLNNLSHTKWDSLTSEENLLFLMEKLKEVGCLQETNARNNSPAIILFIRKLFHMKNDVKLMTKK